VLIKIKRWRWYFPDYSNTVTNFPDSSFILCKHLAPVDYKSIKATTYGLPESQLCEGMFPASLRAVRSVACAGRPGSRPCARACIDAPMLRGAACARGDVAHRQAPVLIQSSVLGTFAAGPRRAISTGERVLGTWRGAHHARTQTPHANFAVPRAAGAAKCDPNFWQRRATSGPRAWAAAVI